MTITYRPPSLTNEYNDKICRRITIITILNYNQVLMKEILIIKKLIGYTTINDKADNNTRTFYVTYQYAFWHIDEFTRVRGRNQLLTLSLVFTQN